MPQMPGQAWIAAFVVRGLVRLACEGMPESGGKRRLRYLVFIIAA